MKMLSSLLTIVMVLTVCQLVSAQDIATARNPVSLLMGYRAARLDALRQLAESIKGIHINSHTTVKDFVTQSDQIESSLNAYLVGAKDAAPPVFKPDGTCEVTLMMDMNLLIAGLQGLNQRFGSNIPPSDFNNIRNNYPRNQLVVTGTGAISSKEYPVFVGWDRVMPQGKLMARRGAQMDAARNIAEAVLGVQIASSTSVQDFVTQKDEIVTRFSGLIRGIRYGQAEYLPSGVVRLKASLDYQAVMAYQQKLYATYSYRPVQYPPVPVEVYGFGVCPPQYYRWNPVVPPAPVAPGQPQGPQGPQGPQQPPWVGQTHKVTGTGAVMEGALNPAQGKLMARRAAFLDGYRQMLEFVQGLKVSSHTTVRDFVTQHDEVKTQINGWIKGVRPVATRYNSDGTVEVDFVLDLSKAWQIVQPYTQK